MAVFRQLIKRCYSQSTERPLSILLMASLEKQTSYDINSNNFKEFLNQDVIMTHKALFPNFVQEASANLKISQYESLFKRFEEYCYYNAPNRELYPSVIMMHAYNIFEKPHKLTYDNFKLASLLAWSFEAVVTSALMQDAIMDNQERRWKRLSWHKNPKVGLSAIADSNLLRVLAYDVVKKHFSNRSFYPNLMYLLSDVIRGVTFGQTLEIEVRTAFKKTRDVRLFTMDKYIELVMQKAYIPVLRSPALAIMYLTNNQQDYFDCEHIFKKLGPHSQVTNDLWDCFGNYETYGRRLGNDIEEGMLSWVVVKALEFANDEQRLLIQENYGRPDPKCREIVLGVFKEIDMVKKYYEYKTKLVEEINADCQQNYRLVRTIVDLTIDVNDDV